MADVAVLGTGRMGAAMVSRLTEAGHTVTIWNRTRRVADDLAAQLGPTVQVAGTPSEAVASSGVILSSFADGLTTCEVLLDDRLLTALPPHATVVDLGTSGVASARLLAAGFAATGAAFVDAPVSGSVPSVLSGSLLVMASGDETAVDRVRPVLAAFARLILHVGPAGAGQAMKLAVNLVVHDLNAALSESLNLAESAGITRELAYSVLEESVVAAPFVKYKRPAFLDPTTPVAMSLALVDKDVELIKQFAAEVGAPVSATAAAGDLVHAAVVAGHGGQDMADLSRLLRL